MIFPRIRRDLTRLGLPPLQITSKAKTRRNYTAQVAIVDSLLLSTGVPYVMENVPGAPLEHPIQLCGSSFGLDVRRHRCFELGGFSVLMVPQCEHDLQRPRFRSLDQRRGGRLASVVGVHGHLNYSGEGAIREAAMQIDWMSNDELAQAIPPAYTEWIGKQLMDHIRERAA